MGDLNYRLSFEQSMRVLIYGFGPYRQFRDNITAKILETLPASEGLKKIVFPVRFDRNQFVWVLKRHRPDIVLGLGQSSRRNIEIEARALNRRREGKMNQRPISAVGPKWLPTTLGIKPGRQARRSRNAGDYVCNYSMYVMLAHLARAKMRIPFGFIHIPHDYERRKARRFVRRVLRQVYRSRAQWVKGSRRQKAARSLASETSNVGV
jgi:pyroglutamyl-peptidase